MSVGRKILTQTRTMVPSEHILKKRARLLAIEPAEFAETIVTEEYQSIGKSVLADINLFLTNKPSTIGKFFTAPGKEVRTIDDLRNITEESAYRYRVLLALTTFFDQALTVKLAKEALNFQAVHLDRLTSALAKKDYTDQSVHEYTYAMAINIETHPHEALNDALQTLELYKQLSRKNFSDEIRQKALDHDSWQAIGESYPQLVKQAIRADRQISIKLTQQVKWLLEDNEPERAKEFLRALKAKLGFYPEDLSPDYLELVKHDKMFF